MKTALFVLSLFLLPSLTEQAQAYDGHLGQDLTVGCVAGAVTFGGLGAYMGKKAGYSYWKDVALEGAVGGCAVGIAVGGAGGMIASPDAQSEEELANADAQEQAPDQE